MLANRSIWKLLKGKERLDFGTKCFEVSYFVTGLLPSNELRLDEEETPVW